MGAKKPSSLFKDLDARLRKAREARKPRHGRKGPQPLGIALRLSVEMAAGLLVGGAIGYFLDQWLGTRPWLMIVFFFLGAAAGILNVMRAAQEMSRSMDEEDKDNGDEGHSPPS